MSIYIYMYLYTYIYRDWAPDDPLPYLSDMACVESHDIIRASLKVH